MCIGVLRDPVKSLLQAKKQKKMSKTVLVLFENSIIFAIAAGIVVAGAGFYGNMLLFSAIGGFFIILISSLLVGLVIHLAARILGGKGNYYEGLTAVVYMMVPITVGFLVASLLTLVPVLTSLQIIIMAVAFVLGLATFYRGIKELYSLDMITTFVVVSVTLLALIASVYVSQSIMIFSNLALMA